MSSRAGETCKIAECKSKVLCAMSAVKACTDMCGARIATQVYMSGVSMTQSAGNLSCGCNLCSGSLGG